MHGYGIHFSNNGVRYEGQFIWELKDGFGSYEWGDGRKYTGWWHKGKQHGLGTFRDSDDGEVKYGVWEFGKRKKWFNP